MPGRVCPAAQARTAGGVDYTLTRRRVRNLNLRVRADGSVAVSAPARVPLAAVDAFVAAHAAWVASAVGRAQARRAAEAAEVLPPKAEALARMQALCAAYYPLFAASCPGGRMPRIAVRDMRTRWGSCHPAKRQITLTARLALQPPAAIEYVVVHEYCHFVHPDHQAGFWALVASILPDWKARRALLRNGR